MSELVPEQTLQEMMTYYKERAQEYDEWFYRQGRYDRSPESNARWFAETDEVFQQLETLHLTGDVLELAPGTGIWTERVLRTATTITAVDASAEMIAINRAKVASARVSYVQADLFSWQPVQTYDAVLFAFFISHVPLERLDSFLTAVAGMLRPGGKVFFVDGRREPSISSYLGQTEQRSSRSSEIGKGLSTAADHQLPALESQVMTRTLNDGRTFTIVKNFYDPVELAARCARAGLTVEVRETATFFLYGCGTRSEPF